MGTSIKGWRKHNSWSEDKRGSTPQEKPTPYQRFRRKAMAVRWLCRVCISVMRVASENALKGSLLEVIEEIVSSAEEEARRTGNAGLLQKGIVSSAYPDMTFDASDFQRFSKREEGVPKKTIEFLKLQEDDRTPEHIENIVRNMQTVEEFAKYPPEIQRKMSEFAWYNKFGRNRVVIKEGYVAEGLYIVLSGQLTETYGGQTYILKKGDKFGESDIIRNCRRTSTVMTKDVVELFCIHSEDYPEVFDTKLNITSEDVMNYVRKIPVFSVWPGIDKLMDSLLNWGIQNYRAGQLIVKDSENNDWIYIIKSGKCDVLKKLTPGVCTLDESRKFYKRYKKAQSALAMQRMHEQQSKIMNKKSESKVTFLTLPNSSPKRTPKIEVMNMDEEPKCDRHQYQIASNNAYGEESESDRHQYQIASNNAYGEESESDRHQYQIASNNALLLDMTEISEKEVLKQFVQEGSSMTTPYCVRVAELEAGDVFGLLSTIPGCKGSQVTLVSQGAEAIRINKQFFLKFADERVFTQIEMRYEAYPSQDDCLSVLDMTSKWQKCKRNEFNKTVHEVHTKIQTRKDSRR
ncbi:uncharacterized protein [Antedon mediterranea]|uniref:uncharacterized protein n=1 Tax=Antedon mediterranea TaxID=105859 RepID=UPI003AF4157D